MKKVFVVSVKILLPILFLYNIGFFNYDFPKFFEDFGKSEPLNLAGQKKLANFINEKVATAEKKGEGYSPDDYFNDLYEIEQVQKSLKGVLNYQIMITPLLSLNQENIRKELFSYKDVDRARDIFMEKRDPGSMARENLKLEMAEKTFWPDLFSWLLNFYLKNLPLACLLFLVWWYRENKNFRINNPLSFLLSLIFYPVIIGLVIYKATKKEGRYYLAEAELRRTKKKMFSLLSTDELADLKRFAESRGFALRDWRAYLTNQGLKPQRILLSSLAVTMLFMALPKFSFSQSLKEREISEISTTTVFKVVPEKPPDQKEYSVAKKLVNHQIETDSFFLASFSWRLDLKKPKPEIIRFWYNKLIPQIFVHKIEHVPFFAI